MCSDPTLFFSHVLHYPQNDCNRNLSNLYPSNNYLNLWLSFYLKGPTRAFWRSYTLPPERIVIRFICNVLCVSCYCLRWFFPYFYGSSNCSALSTYFQWQVVSFLKTSCSRETLFQRMFRSLKLYNYSLT